MALLFKCLQIIFPKIKSSSQELSDFYFVEADTPELIHEKLMTMVTERIPARFGFDSIRHIQVLVPMNRGGLGARALNIELQTAHLASRCCLLTTKHLARRQTRQPRGTCRKPRWLGQSPSPTHW